MRREWRSSILGSIKWLTAAILVAALPLAAVQAQSGRARLAPDLVKKVKSSSSSERVTIIATLSGDSTPDKLAADIEALGGQVRNVLRHVRQAVLEMPAGNVPLLQGVAGLSYLAPDRQVHALASHLGTTSGASQVYPSEYGTTIDNIVSGFYGYDGRGVTVAVIDSGVDVDHFDLRDGGTRRTLASIRWSSSGSGNDPYGHGTFVAGLVAGNGYSSKQGGLDFTGVAPKANLVSLRVLDENGRGSLSSVIAAVDWAIANSNTYRIRVLNMSLAAPPVDSYRDDPLCQAVDRASRAGLVVVAAAGNFGIGPEGTEVYGGITSPGNSPAVVTVGATDTRGTNVRSDDSVAPYSSRGATRSRSVDPVTGAVTYDNLAKPDLVAPGTRLISLERADSTLILAIPQLHVPTKGDSNSKSRYMFMSGTSMSTGVVSGAVALMLSANPSLTPNMVKAILMYSAQRVDGADLFEQGAGQVNVAGAVRLAAAMRKDANLVRTGSRLIPYGSMPVAETTISDETFAWSQGLIWGFGWLYGSTTLTTQQDAFAQGLIWNFHAYGDSLSLWGASVSYQDGLASDTHVVYADNNQWKTVISDQGTTTATGVVYYDDLAASGVDWRNTLMTDMFYTVDSTGLIWNYLSLFDQGLIWGYYAFDVGLIWGFYSYFDYSSGYGAF
jgi:subtilisin family serine protease